MNEMLRNSVEISPELLATRSRCCFSGSLSSISILRRNSQVNGLYNGQRLFSYLVNVVPNENLVHEICCSECGSVLALRFDENNPALDIPARNYALTMASVSYWDGEEALNGDDGLKEMLAELHLFDDIEEDPLNEDVEDQFWGAWQFGPPPVVDVAAPPGGQGIAAVPEGDGIAAVPEGDDIAAVPGDEGKAALPGREGMAARGESVAVLPTLGALALFGGW